MPMGAPQISPLKRAKKSTWPLEEVAFSDATAVGVSKMADGIFKAT